MPAQPVPGHQQTSFLPVPVEEIEARTPWRCDSPLFGHADAALETDYPISDFRALGWSFAMGGPPTPAPQGTPIWVPYGTLIDSAANVLMPAQPVPGHQQTSFLPVPVEEIEARTPWRCDSPLFGHADAALETDYPISDFRALGWSFAMGGPPTPAPQGTPIWVPYGTLIDSAANVLMPAQPVPGHQQTSFLPVPVEEIEARTPWRCDSPLFGHADAALETDYPISDFRALGWSFAMGEPPTPAPQGTLIWVPYGTRID
ncbi:uncharacterized protein LOC144112122 [Amblyomma americanum]